MKVIFSELQKDHYPKHFLSSGARQENPEVPERADRLLQAALDAGLELLEPEDAGLEPVSAVHTPEYTQFLQNIYRRWCYIEGASPEVVPNIHPARRDGAYPASAVGQAGYHMLDTGCPISAETWGSALVSAHVALQGAALLVDEEDCAYALCRPPGHHAGKDYAAGFCYLNNSAIAAQELLAEFGRVAILDIDVHHGNGTQDIFYQRSDVLTVSLHADPARFYPFFWGHAAERGEGDGLGYNLNIPLSRGTGDKDYITELDRALARIEAFAPGALVVALGLDAHESDPFQGLAITTGGFGKIAARIAGLELPTLLVQEGGYLSDDLGANLQSFLDGFSA
ncbi:MAG TPA: histone deacetylase family protein [Xanthomonadales bacterium]|nr:histone deacetylase family protein [Xanthomonadales bacterium]